ncbi:MAG: hypothetical protein ABEK50_05205 [bacterium]
MNDFLSVEKLRNFLNRYIFLKTESDNLYKLFRLKMRQKSNRRYQFLFGLTGLLVLLFWPEDFQLDKSKELIQAFAIYRSTTILLAVLTVVALRYWKLIKRNLNAFLTFVGCLYVFSVAYPLGSVETFTYPWFDFMCFLLPMYSLIMSIDVFRRFLVTLLWILVFVASWVHSHPVPIA